MSAITVFSAKDALAAATADRTKIMTAEKKKDDKAYKGTRYLNLYFNIGNSVKAEGWFNMTDVKLSTGMADPADKLDKRNEYEGTRMQLETSVSRAGDFGKFLLLANETWIEMIQKLAAEGVIVPGARKVHELLQTTLSADNKNNPNGKIDDPLIRFKVDFSAHPEKYRHKFLAGKQKSQILDFTKKYVDADGKVQYQVATVKDPQSGQEVPVNSQNIHLFVKDGAILRSARVMIPSIAISQAWISAPITISRAVIEPGSGGGFSDDCEIESATAAVASHVAESNQSLQSQSSQQNEQSAANAQNTQPPAAVLTAGDIDDVLAGI